MYAIVEIAGQQFKVEAGNEIFVHRLADAKGAEVVLDDTVKADKVIVFKKIRRKGFQTLNGHRQKLSKIRINEIA